MCEWPRGCVQLKLDFETKHLDAPVLVLRTKNKKALVGKWCTEGPKGVGSRKKEYEYISVPPLRIALSL